MNIKELIKSMTLEEKIGQLNQCAYTPDNVDVIKERIRKGKVGSIIFAQSAFAGNDSPYSVNYEKANHLHRCLI